MFLYEEGFPIKSFAKGVGISASDWINLQPKMSLEDYTPIHFEWISTNARSELKVVGLPQEMEKFLKVGKIARFPKKDSATGNIQYLELYDKVIRNDEVKHHGKIIDQQDFMKALTYLSMAVTNPLKQDEILKKLQDENLALPAWAFT